MCVDISEVIERQNVSQSLSLAALPRRSAQHNLQEPVVLVRKDGMVATETKPDDANPLLTPWKAGRFHFSHRCAIGMVGKPCLQRPLYR